MALQPGVLAVAAATGLDWFLGDPPLDAASSGCDGLVDPDLASWIGVVGEGRPLETSDQRWTHHRGSGGQQWVAGLGNRIGQPHDRSDRLRLFW